MSKTLNTLEQVKEIRRNKLTVALEKGRAAAQPAPSAAPPAETVAKHPLRPAAHRTGEKYLVLGVPVLMAAVIVLGVVFVVINYRVLSELNSVKDSMAVVMHNTGAQTGKVSSIESSLAQFSAENKKLRNDLDRQEKVTSAVIEKIQSDVAETEIAAGIMRSKLSELSATQKKLLDQYIDLSSDVLKFKITQAGTAQ